MLRIRCLEEKSAELYGAMKIRGFLHLYIGEEAVAVGVMQALTSEDAVVATYREHSQALARGVPAATIMAEMYGKQEGCSRGEAAQCTCLTPRPISMVAMPLLVAVYHWPWA
jgi:pyruvate dehydrogenase E1 component alpha subunit